MAVIGSTLIGLPVKSSNWANNGCCWFDWHWLAREKTLIGPIMAVIGSAGTGLPVKQPELGQ